MLFAAGGTGGHLFPGIAVAEAARQAVGAEVLFVGTQNGMEKDVIPQMGFPLQFIPAQQLRGRDWLGVVHALVAAGRAVGVAWRIVRKFTPDVIFSIGGYASGPTVVVGWLRRIPCVLLEPNTIPGMTNKLLGRFAAKVCVGFAPATKYFPTRKAIWTGNPVRWSDSESRKDAGRTQSEQSYFTLFIFGGSAGARRINQILPQAVGLLGATTTPLRIVHQTGKADYEDVKSLYTTLGVKAEVVSFIEDMREMYLAADLVVCRAGAMTVAELTSLGKPAILIPYPYAVDDHQRANAEVLVGARAAQMVLDAELTPERVSDELRTLIADRQRLAAMAQAMASLGRPDATMAVVRECLACVPASIRPNLEEP